VGVVTILTHHISDMARATKNPLEYNIILGIKWKKMHTNWTLQ
jgi:hypothetical protein